jgi:hypothetical protein
MATIIKPKARKLLAQGKARFGYANLSYPGLASKKHATVYIPTDDGESAVILRVGYDELDQWIHELDIIRRMCIEESVKGA